MATQSGPIPPPNPPPGAPPPTTAVGPPAYPVYDPTYTPPPPAPLLSRAQIALIVIGVIVFLVLSCLFLIWMNSIGALNVLRDVLIVFLAFESILVFILLAWLLLQLQSLVEYLNNEVKPILQSLQESATTAQTTTTFLRDTVVDPLITARSRYEGVAQAVRTLFGRS